MQSAVLDRIAKNLSDIGTIAFDDYLQGHSIQPAPSQHCTSATDGNAVTRLHQACRRAFHSADALKFEFIEHPGSRNKQCILTITKPDGVRRSYATQPVFAKKNEAKSEAAKIALDMGALDFLAGETKPVPDSPRSAETSSADSAPPDAMSVQSTTVPEAFVDDIEKCCLDWRAGRVTPHWVPFFDPKLPYKQGCALRIQLSPHVARIYLSGSTFDTLSDAKGACAKAAVLEGVLDFIKHGNGQTRPSSPIQSTPSTSQCPPVAPTTPWTLQAFYDSLPRPFPESFETQTHDASQINALGWMNSMTQNARGGKLILSFFFTSNGPPGLHGCILKLDRPGEYKASLIDARFPKRSDAKAAVCLQAVSEGIGDYIHSIASAVDNKVSPTMRSFSSSLVYPALTSGLSKIDTVLHPHVEYHKERDAYGATLVIRLSTLPASGQVQRYTVPSHYRSKADAKVAVICHAAEQGVIEFVRFRGEIPPDGYISPFNLHTFNPDASRKRKQSGSVEDVEQGQPAKKKQRTKRGTGARSRRGHPTPMGQSLSVCASSDQIHGISGPDDMGLSQSVPADGLCDPSRPGVGGGVGSGATRPVVYGHRVPYGAQMYAPSYPSVLDPRFAGGDGMGSSGYGVHALPAYGSDPPRTVDAMPPERGPSRAWPGASSRTLRRPTEDAELEPGEVVSSAESDFSVGSSRNEDSEVPPNEEEIGLDMSEKGKESVDVGNASCRSNDKAKAKETSPANTSTTVSHVKNLIDYCAQHHCGTPSFHEMQCQGRLLVWIVIGRERFDLPTTYATAEEGRQRVAKQVLARLSKGSSS
ncbi:hypothetical protein L210DRAFT_3626351 [Boletus edulis BED1]|uniref:Uncharacterized protein n=1 Tax=Boletus edulis BED1 TaxID=1328754 RepID=A0AAD4C7M6_BOLED|nr:hypothetical protein L210DRAFT_3626351 [Boletus edulis BED1]